MKITVYTMVSMMRSGDVITEVFTDQQSRLESLRDFADDVIDDEVPEDADEEWCMDAIHEWDGYGVYLGEQELEVK